MCGISVSLRTQSDCQVELRRSFASLNTLKYMLSLYLLWFYVVGFLSDEKLSW